MPTAEIIRTPLLYSGQRLDREEFYRRVEEWERTGRNLRGIERLEGVVYMAAASIRAESHGEPQAMIAAWLGTYAALTAGVQPLGSATTKLDDDNDPEGDAILRIRPEYGGQSQTDEKGYIAGAPELIVEIAASTTQKDLELKFEIYRRNGVREYLVWETIGEEFYWFALENGEYVRRVPDANHHIHSRIFPGLWLDVEALLSGNLARVLQVVQQGTAAPEHAAFVELLESRRMK